MNYFYISIKIRFDNRAEGCDNLAHFSFSPLPLPPPPPPPPPLPSSSCPENRTMSFPVLRQGSILHGEDNRTDLTCQTFGDQHVVMITQTGRVGTLIQVGVEISQSFLKIVSYSFICSFYALLLLYSFYPSKIMYYGHV